MVLKKLKTLIYIILFVFALNFILPVYSFAIDKNSIYVWSNNSSSVSTSNTTTEKTMESNSTENTSR